MGEDQQAEGVGFWASFHPHFTPVLFIQNFSLDRVINKFPFVLIGLNFSVESAFTAPPVAHMRQ